MPSLPSVRGPASPVILHAQSAVTRFIQISRRVDPFADYNSPYDFDPYDDLNEPW